MNRLELLCLPTRVGADWVRRIVDEEADDPLEELEGDESDDDDDDRSECGS